MHASQRTTAVTAVAADADSGADKVDGHTVAVSASVSASLLPSPPLCCNLSDRMLQCMRPWNGSLLTETGSGCTYILDSGGDYSRVLQSRVLYVLPVIFKSLLFGLGAQTSAICPRR